MAKFIPDIETIQKLRVKPTNGEWYLLNFLSHVLDDSYEVYFNPYLNGDRPDFVIMRENHGVLVIEVKDWNLPIYSCSNKRWFVYKSTSITEDSLDCDSSSDNALEIKSPISQVRRYYENLMGFHIPDLYRLRLTDNKTNAIVSTMLFFYGACRDDFFENKNFIINNQFHYDFVGLNVLNLYKDKKDYIKVKNYSAYNSILTQEDLSEYSFNELLKKNYIGLNSKSQLFTNEIYRLFKHQLSPTEHFKNQVRDILYTDSQLCIIYDSHELKRKNGPILIPNKRPTQNAYIRGVYGSGKTTVLAATAIQTYLSLRKKIVAPRILILCYNLSLVNWIKCKLNEVNEDFNINNFVIINYHKFITSALNNLNVPFHVPEEIATDKEKLTPYLEEHYYGNVELFEDIFSSKVDLNGKNLDFYKFDAVFIDEIQDYHYSWTEIINRFFLYPNGKFYVFGDEKQNIYGNQVINQKVEVYFGEKSVKNIYLKECKRSNPEIQDFLKKYQKCFLANKYEVDEFESFEKQTSLIFKFDYDETCTIDFVELSGKNSIEKRINFLKIIQEYIDKRGRSISPSDMTVLAQNVSILRKIDALFRYKTGSKTESMFENYEEIFLTWMKGIAHETTEEKKFNSCLLEQIIFPKHGRYNCLAILLTIYILYTRFPSVYYDVLYMYCHMYKVNIDLFIQTLNNNQKTFNHIIKKLLKLDYTDIRDNKKLHFSMLKGCPKMSTIHSFKGWESRLVFLYLEEKLPDEKAFAELIYTGLSRAKEHLIVINAGNVEYGSKINELIEETKKESVQI